MSKVRLLTIAVALLVLVNIAALTALYLGRPGNHGPRRGEGPKAVVIERLHFDAGQVQAYEALIRQHRATIDRLDGALLEDRSALYQGLRSPDRARQDSLLAACAATERMIESTHLAHFEAIRALCRPDQLPYFDELVNDLAGLFRPRGQGPR